MSQKTRLSLVPFLTASIVITFFSCTKPNNLRDKGAKEITSFVFKLNNNPTLTTDINGVINSDSILVTVPVGTDISHLTPTISFNSKSVSPLSNVVQNFNKPVIYTVTAMDGSAKTYTVVVKVEAGDATLYINSTYPNPPGLGKLYAIDPKTGVLRWKYTLTVNADESSPTSYAGMIYMGMGRSVIALNPVTHQIKWQFPTAYNQTNAAVANGVVYANGEDDYLYAIDAATGNQNWKYKFGDDQHAITNCSPTYSDGVVYIADGNGYVDAINASRGNLIWKVTNPISWASGFSSNPAVVNGSLYIGDYQGYIYSIDIKDGSFKWSFGPTQQIVSSPTVADSTVYIGGGNTCLYALDVASGKVKWKYYAGESIEASPIVSDGIVFFGTTGPNGGHFYAIDAATGARKWFISNDADFYSSPVVYNNTVYVASYAVVLAFDTKVGYLKWTFHTDDPLEEVRSSPCIVDNQGNVYNPGISGNQN
jgi:outer membrane protein assembly factor BamB